MKIQELIDLLPDSWNSFKFKDYQKCLDLKIDESSNEFAGINNTLGIASAISGISVEELESLPLPIVQQIGKKLSFMIELPEPEKKANSIKWKNIEDTSYNDFVSFITLSGDPVHNFPSIIKTFCKSPITEEDINEMSVAEVYQAFFTLKKHVLKSLNHSKKQTAITLMKQSQRELRTLIRKKLKLTGKK